MGGRIGLLPGERASDADTRDHDPDQGPGLPSS